MGGRRTILIGGMVGEMGDGVNPNRGEAKVVACPMARDCPKPCTAGRLVAFRATDYHERDFIALAAMI
jgi:hypothetical protein